MSKYFTLTVSTSSIHLLLLPAARVYYQENGKGKKLVPEPCPQLSRGCLNLHIIDKGYINYQKTVISDKM